MNNPRARTVTAGAIQLSSVIHGESQALSDDRVLVGGSWAR